MNTSSAGMNTSSAGQVTHSMPEFELIVQRLEKLIQESNEIGLNSRAKLNTLKQIPQEAENPNKEQVINDVVGKLNQLLDGLGRANILHLTNYGELNKLI